jgi:uncharacterized protein DUF3800
MRLHRRTFNVYCDESGHLEHDGQAAMVLGGVWCDAAAAPDSFVRIREIKQRHGLNEAFEVKWTKVSPAQLVLYLDLVDYFFDDGDLHFRGLVADKSNLDHKAYRQSHDDWYYRMYFDMLKLILEPRSSFRIYLDIKDTCSAEKVRRLHQVLANTMFDFSLDIVERVQSVRSHEVELLQLCDLLVGAIAASNREDQIVSAAKRAVAARVTERSGYKLTRSTLFREEKFNLFHWTGRPVD